MFTTGISPATAKPTANSTPNWHKLTPLPPLPLRTTHRCSTAGMKGAEGSTTSRNFVPLRACV